MFVKWVGSPILNCINIYFFIDPFLLCGRESTRVVGWNVIGRKLGGCNILGVVVEDLQKWNKVVCPAWLALWRKWKKQINGSLIISHRTISCNEMSFRRILSWSENSDGNFLCTSGTTWDDATWRCSTAVPPLLQTTECGSWSCEWTINCQAQDSAILLPSGPWLYAILGGQQCTASACCHAYADVPRQWNGDGWGVRNWKAFCLYQPGYDPVCVI